MPDPQQPVTRTPEEHFRAMIAQYGVPEEFARTIKTLEGSRSHTVAGGKVLTSGKNARGWFQVLPETAAAYGLNADDPFQNIEAGVRNMREGLEKNGWDPDKAFAYYHGGSNLKLHGPLTAAYARRGGELLRSALTVKGETPQSRIAPPQAPAKNFAPDARGIGPTTDWELNHPTLNNLANSLDPHEVEGRHNIAGAVGGAGGGLLGAMVGGITTPVTGPVGPAVGAKIGSAIGAGIAGGAEHALIEETPIGPWLSQNLPFGQQDQKYTPDPNKTPFERSMAVGGEQGLYDILGSALGVPIKAGVKRMVQSRVGRFAGQALEDARRLALEKLYGGLDLLKTAGRVSTDAANQTRAAVKEQTTRTAEDTARDAAQYRLEISRRGGQQFRDANAELQAAREAAAARVQQHGVLSDSAVKAAREKAAREVERATAEHAGRIEAFRTQRLQPLLDQPPRESEIGQRVARVFEGPAQEGRNVVGRAVREAAEKMGDLDPTALQEEAARLAKTELFPPVREFPAQAGGIQAAVPGGPPAPPSSGIINPAGGMFPTTAPPAAGAATLGSAALQSLTADVGSAGVDALKKHPAMKTILEILNQPAGQKVTGAAAHLWKKKLRNAIRGTFNQTEKSEVAAITQKLTGMLDAMLDADPAYRAASEAYAKLAPTFTKGPAATIRRTARYRPAKIVQSISMDDPDGAAALVDILTTHTERGGKALSAAEAAATAKEGRAALGEVQKAWVYRNITEGGMNGLGDRIAKLRQRPEFVDVFLSDGPGKAALDSLEEIARAVADAEASHAAKTPVVKKAGEAGIRQAEELGATVRAQIEKENAEAIARVQPKPAAAALARKTALEDADQLAKDIQQHLAREGRAAGKQSRQAATANRTQLAEDLQAQRAKIRARATGTDPQGDVERAFERSSIGSKMRAPEQVMADVVNMVNLGGYHGKIGLIRLLKGPNSADLLRYLSTSPIGTRILVKVLLNPATTPIVGGGVVKAGYAAAEGKPSDQVEDIKRSIGMPPPAPPKK